MISHDFRCIFVHIPRCAGTSIETWICGQDWWGIEPSTKHLIASQAREIYAEWWDDYFKLSIVRDPYSRTRSLLKHGEHFGLARGQAIDFSGYEALFGTEPTLEHDHRFADRGSLLKPAHRPGQIYGNILDESLDFVAHFETLAQDMAFVQKRLGIPRPFASHAERSERIAALAARDEAWIEAAYSADFYRFGYGSHGHAQAA